MNGFMILRFLLLPFSMLYGIITFLRNKFYDWGIFKSVHYNVCVISIGNITVGGTGKTPHTEYLVRTLSEKYKIAILSRGYKRKTKGFVMATIDSAVAEIGDEPCQMKRKFPHIIVAVDVNRIKGIQKIRELHPDVQIILLDDAFQYRKIIPGLSILLLDYHRPLYRDCMLPGGNMREWSCLKKRANILIVSKSPAGISLREQQEIKDRYHCGIGQEMYFTSIVYDFPRPLFDGQPLMENFTQYSVLLLSGIAAPAPFEKHVRQMFGHVEHISFPDHHAFSGADVRRVSHQWDVLHGDKKVIITTEKDAIRLRTLPIPSHLLSIIYYIPIKIELIGNREQEFLLHVQKFLHD